MKFWEKNKNEHVLGNTTNPIPHCHGIHKEIEEEDPTVKTCKYPNCGKWTDNTLYNVPVCEEHEILANFIVDLIEGHAKVQRELEACED